MYRYTRPYACRKSPPYRRRTNGNTGIAAAFAFVAGIAVTILLIYIMPVWLIWLICGAVVGAIVGCLICKVGK